MPPCAPPVALVWRSSTDAANVSASPSERKRSGPAASPKGLVRGHGSNPAAPVSSRPSGMEAELGERLGQPLGGLVEGQGGVEGGAGVEAPGGYQLEGCVHQRPGVDPARPEGHAL